MSAVGVEERKGPRNRLMQKHQRTVHENGDRCSSRLNTFRLLLDSSLVRCHYDSLHKSSATDTVENSRKVDILQ